VGYRRLAFLSLEILLVLSFSVFGGAAIPVRDGFFGVSGILPDKTLLGELKVDCVRYGFFIGPTDASFIQGNNLHTRQMTALVEQGVSPMATFWAPEVADDARASVEAIVSYYTSGQGALAIGAPVHYWEIGNEENGAWKTSCLPEEFARRVAIISSGIRAACPACRIVMGGLQDGPQMGEWALEPYLTRFLEAGGGEWIDVYAFHYYGLANPQVPTPEVETYLSGEEVLARMRRVLDHFGKGSSPVWVTETSTFSGRVGDVEQSEDEQAADLVKRFVSLRSLGVEKVFWTYLTEPKYEGTGEGFFDQAGLVYDGFGPSDLGAGVKKKGFFAYQELVRELDETEFSGCSRDAGVTLVRFRRGEGTVSVLWQDPWIRQGPVWVSPRASVRVVDLYGHEVGTFLGTFKLDLELKPVYLQGEVDGISTHPPALQGAP